MAGQTENPYLEDDVETTPSVSSISRQFLILSVLIAVLLFQVMFSTRTIWGQVWERNGQIAFEQRDWQEARRYYLFSAGLNPGNHRALYDLGLASRNMGDPALAFQAQQYAVKLSPYYSPSLVELAELYIQQERWGKATAHLDRAEQITPAYWKVYYARGEIAMRQGDLEGAAAAYEKAVTVAAQPVMAVHASLGNTYYQLEHWKLALAAIDDSIALNKNIPQYHVLRGEILVKMNKRAGAKKSWEWASYLYSVPPFDLGEQNMLESEALARRLDELNQ